LPCHRRYHLLHANAQNECQALGRERDELPAYVANYRWGLNTTPLDPPGGARDEWGVVDVQTILALDDRRPNTITHTNRVLRLRLAIARRG